MFDIPKEELMDKNLAQLRELASKLDHHIVDPNAGGCCVIAVEVAKRLRDIYPTKLRVATDWDEFADTNVQSVARDVRNHADCWEWNDNGIFFGHVVVEFKYKGLNYHLDTNGVARAKGIDPSFGWFIYPGELPFEAAKILAAQSKDVWNSRFNRKQIPKIRKLVDRFFEDAQLTQS